MRASLKCHLALILVFGAGCRSLAPPPARERGLFFDAPRPQAPPEHEFVWGVLLGLALGLALALVVCLILRRLWQGMARKPGSPLEQKDLWRIKAALWVVEDLLAGMGRRGKLVDLSERLKQKRTRRKQGSGDEKGGG